MKNITFGAIVLITTAFLTEVACAQSANQIKQIQSFSDIATLQRLSGIWNAAHAANYSKALEYAAKHKWELYKTSAEGDFMVLDGITSDNQPVYHQSLNRNAGIACRASKVYNNGGPLQLNIQGQGMIAAIWDVGPVRITHEAFENRAVQIDMPVTANTAFFTAHPTHVAGTIIASSTVQDGTVRGTAFNGSLAAYTSSNDRSEAATAAANGLLVSNHSYASDGTAGGFAGLYNTIAHDWDQIMFAAPYYLSVWAAGNAGGPTTKISNSASSKNGMTVGSIADVSYPDGYFSPIYSSNIPYVLTPTSSAGPTRDGRIKPDIMTRGVNIYSAMSDSDSSYAYSTGTSMATPSATGSVLLLQQLYLQQHAHYMKSATVKALIIHTATELGTPGPKPNTGWGLLNVENAAYAIVNDGGISGIYEEQLSNGGTFTKTVTHTDTCPLIVTLAWTDPAGIGISDTANHSPRLINDLDLKVTSGNTTLLPWRLDASGNSEQGNNSVDNVEKIQIFNAVPGQSYTITVSHKGTLQQGSQYFSLICSGIDSIYPMSTYVNNLEDEENMLSIFPNPNNGLFTVKSNVLTSGKIQVFDMEGRLLSEKLFTNSKSTNIDISNFTNGVYLLRFTTGDKVLNRTIVKR